MNGMFVAAAMVSALLVSGCFSWASEDQVERRDGAIYIVDRRGERWEVTQAASLGFRPDAFQYGIGRYAFRPLDDSLVRDGAEGGWGDPRVIGVAAGGEANAYAVGRLSRHEIANSRIGDKPVAAAY